MALTERLQILLESAGGTAVVRDLKQIGDAGKAEMGKVSAAAEKASATVRQASERMVLANQRLEAAQLKAAQAAQAVAKAQQTVAGASGPYRQLGAVADNLERAQLRAAHAAQAVTIAQERASAATAKHAQVASAASGVIARHEAAQAKLATTSAAAAGGIGRASGAASLLGANLGTAVTLGATAAGFALLRFGTETVRSFTTVAKEVDAVQDVMGGTAEESSRVRSIAKALGIEVDSVAMSMFRLSRNLTTNRDALRASGVEIARQRDGSTDLHGTLLNLSDAYNRLQDPVAKNQLLFDAFGRSGLAMQDILELGRQRLEEIGNAGPVVNAEQIELAKEFDRSLKQLTDSAHRFGVGMGTAVVPGLNSVVSLLNRLVAGADAAGRNVGVSLKRIAKAAQLLGPLGPFRILDALLPGGKSGGAPDDLPGLVGPDTAALKDQSGRLSDAFERAFSGRATAAEATRRYSEAEAAALAKVSAAAENYGATQERIAEQVAQAQERASARLVAATERVVEAEQRAARDREAALERVRDAEQRALEQRQSAAERVRDAEQRLADVRERQGASATTGSTVRERLVARRQELRDAERDVDRARGEQAKAETKAIEDVERARRDLADTELRVADEVQRARRDLSEAEAEVARASELTTAQRRELANAEESLADTRREAAAEVAVAMQRHLKDLLELGATADEVGNAFDRHVEDLRKVAAQMGLNEEQTQRLVDRYGLIPPTRQTVVELAGVNEALVEADRFVRGLSERLRGDTIIRAALGTDTLSPQQAEAIRRQVTGRERGGPIPGAARGMVVRRPTVLVGEGNPEWPEYVLATDPRYRGENVGYWLDAGQRLGMLASGGPISGDTLRRPVIGSRRDTDYVRLEAVLKRVLAQAAGMGNPQISVVANGLRDDAMPHHIAREIRRELYLSGR